MDNDSKIRGDNIGSEKLRVLQIISSPVMGGVERQVLALLERYDKNRFVVDVACGKSTDGALRDEYLATGSRLILCRWSSYVFPFVLRLFWLLRRERYSVIHARMSEVSGAAMLAAKLANVPTRIASYEHTHTDWRNPGTINRLAVVVLQWMARRWATKILGVSESCLDVYYPDWRQRPGQFQICYNGVDIKQFSRTVTPHEVRRELGLPGDSQVVGHVGGFRKIKNHQTLIDVAERVSEQLENVYFLLVGEGKLRQQIEKEVAKRGLSSRFVFTGNRYDVARLLAAMDVFVFPSLFEAFGIVAVEAQLSKLPIVASDLPGIREVLCPAMHKFCQPPLDSAGMAEQVISLLEDPQLRGKLGHEAREYVASRFLIDRTVKQLETIYDSATAS